MAAVLLRRLISTFHEQVWPELGTDIKEWVKGELLNGIQQETVPLVQRRICDAAAELARNLVGECNSDLPPTSTCGPCFQARYMMYPFLNLPTSII